jgi:large subunit ribosomal protein L7/L12
MSMTQQELIDAISSLTLLEAADLSKALQEKFGVSAAAPVAYAAAPGAAAGDAAAVPDLPTSFDVVLTAAGEKRLGVIKIVREVTGQGLKESKDLVEGVPSKIKEGLNKEDADALKAKFEAEGASIEIKPAG